MDYGYKVVKGPKELAACGWSAYVGHPFIMDGRPGYAETPNAYLIDRGLGLWDPIGRGTRNDRRPARRSLINYADWLANALEWADTRGVDLLTADYATVLIAGYQAEMLAGIWSSTKKSLSANTVNLRVQAVVDYQLWAHDKGIREAFELPTTTRTVRSGSATNSRGHEARKVESRRGKVKVPSRDLVLPPDEWVAAWIRRVKARPELGATEELIADLILHTAIRVGEAACWRMDTLPEDPALWVITNPTQPVEDQLVQVELKYGTKGPDLAVDEYGDKIGKPEFIKMPLRLAKKIHSYRTNTRPKAIQIALRGAGNVAQSRKLLAQKVHLFINPLSGERYTVAQIQYFWKLAKGENCPYDWSPHMGRHYWACKKLDRSMDTHAQLIESLVKSPGISMQSGLRAALKDTAMTVLVMEIQPQLRHADSKTTNTYLRWLFSSKGIAMNFTEGWLEEESSTT